MTMESHGGMILTGENGRTQTKTCSTSTFSAINPTWTDLVMNMDMSGEVPATNGLSPGTATRNKLNK
jgi:hypothetical protein